jgi:hypothetical protein
MMRPPTRGRDELRRLHQINALFAQVTGQDLYLAEQIRSAIAFSLAELEEQTAQEPELAEKLDAKFNAAATKLLDKLFSALPRQGFFAWDASETVHGATMLFARAEVMAGLKQLARYPEATLLVTNLRPALLPPERRETARRQRDYQEVLGFIRDLAAARTVPGTNLQLLFL